MISFTANQYIEKQLLQVAPLPLAEDNYPYGFDIQIKSNGARRTNHLRITVEQMKQIEYVLRYIR